jgi:hypothetical protein
MKTTIQLIHDDGGRFADVARLIVDSPPGWLMDGLAQFSELIGADRVRKDDFIEQMHDAADLLIKWLPAYSHMPILDQPNDVAVALKVLPRIRADLARLKQRRRGARPNVQRRVCAGVISEMWRLVHGRIEGRSLKLYEACEAYWTACGHEARGADIENWRRDIEHNGDRSWIADVLMAHRGT